MWKKIKKFFGYELPFFGYELPSLKEMAKAVPISKRLSPPPDPPMPKSIRIKSGIECGCRDDLPIGASFCPTCGKPVQIPLPVPAWNFKSEKF